MTLNRARCHRVGLFSRISFFLGPWFLTRSTRGPQDDFMIYLKTKQLKSRLTDKNQGFYRLLSPLLQKASQGDSADLICDMQMDNVPVSTISGQTMSKRILSVYTHLKEFLPHMKTVMEQQKDLNPPRNPVVEGLHSMITHVRHIALQVNCVLQTLQPNIPIPEPAERPMGIPPAQNIFQQKAYGCIVLSRLQKLLSQAVQEQRSLKEKMCRKRTKNGSWWTQYCRHLFIFIFVHL